MSEQLLIQKSTLVDIADAVRVKTGKTEEIAVVDLAAEIKENISVGMELPELTNPGESTDLLSGKELIDSDGNIVVGTMPNNNAVSKTLDTLITSYTIPEGYHDGSGKVSITTETKFITPTKDVQTVSPANDKVLSCVTVEPIPSEYQDVSEVTATASDVLSGKKIVNSAGSVITGTIAFQPAKTITPSTTRQIAVSSGYYTSGDITIAAIPSTYIKPTYTKVATTYTPTTTNQTISAGTYCSGVQTIKGDSNLKAENIKSGVSIFGVSGTAEVGGDSSGEGCGNEDSLITRDITSYTNSRVSSVGPYAFTHATNLKSVIFLNVESIGEHAFDTCRSLTTINFPKATTIGESAFYLCSNLTTISFPNATTIGRSAFGLCYSLTTINFPKATTIGSYAFRMCSHLTTISFPNATTVGSYAFGYCDDLTTVSLPNVTTIGYYAFSNCTSLTTASFPAATSIAYNVFQSCYNLKSLYLTNSIICTLSHSNAFSSTPIGGYSASAGTYGSIYVPASLLTSYQTATNWTYFSSRFVGV